MTTIDVGSLRFPVICVRGGSVRVKHSPAALTLTTTAGVENGMFTGMTLIEANGRAWEVARARVLEGVGLLGGWNIFLNRRVRIALDTDSAPTTLEPSVAGELIATALMKGGLVRSAGEPGGLLKALRRAGSIPEIADVLGE